MRLSRSTLVPVAVVALSLVSAEGVAAKCSSRIQMPGLEFNDAVVLLDGSIVPDVGTAASGGLTLNEFAEAFDIEWAELTCWNPTTGEFGGVGVPIWSLHTKSFVESTRAPIEGLLRAQGAYFSEFSRYAQSRVELVVFGLPRDAMLEFSVTSAGWSATTPRDDVAFRCFVFSGDAPKELAEMKEHEIVCQSEAAKANPALREMYEGSADFDLQQNYPNPFNPATTIPFILHEGLFTAGLPVQVSMRIFNVLTEPVASPIALGHSSGEGVELIELEYTQPGTYEAFWDGTNQSGREVASGIYFVQLKVNGLPPKQVRLYRRL